MKPRAVFLAGPTGCGKSQLAASLAARFGGEVVSVDSCAVYAGMDIGSAKPPPALRSLAPHHLLDIRAPNEVYSVGDFFQDALRLVAEINARGRLPILAGGAMMFFHSLREGLHAFPPSSPAARARARRLWKKRGAFSLHRALRLLDSKRAAQLSPADGQRLARALEVRLSTGRPMSAWLQQPPQRPDWNVLSLKLMPPDAAARAKLRGVLQARLDEMLAAGLLQETANLLKIAPPDSPPMRAVNYRQAAARLRGEYDDAEFRARALAATLQLARRQRGWLRRWTDATTLNPFSENLEKEAAAAVINFLPTKNLLVQKPAADSAPKISAIN